MTVPRALNGVERMGVAFPKLGESDARAFLLEFILSFFLMLLILAIRNTETRKSSILLAFNYMALRLLAIPITGSTLNPARALGHAIVGSSVRAWSSLWIYLIAPFLGVVSSTLVYLFISPKLY